MLSVLLLIAFASFVDSQNSCLNPFITQGEYEVCYQIFSADSRSRRITVSKGSPHDLGDVDSQGNRRYAPGVREAQLAKQERDDKDEFERKQASESKALIGRKKRQTHPAGDIWDCMDIPCICSYLPGASMYTSLVCRLSDGSFYGKVQRKDFRLMSTPERNLFASGFKAVRTGIYWTLAGFHANLTSSPGAHSGPNFMPWHREFLKRLEIGIRTFRLSNGTYPYTNVAIPYWDSSMDDDVYKLFGSSLNLKSYNGIFFSSYLMGSVVNGQLNDGYFGLWYGRNGYTWRELDRFPGQVTLFARSDIDTMINNPSINNILAATAGDPGSCPPVPSWNLEIRHGWVHVWVGGNMKLVETSTNDPIFFMHHGFVDFIWEEWRLKWQDRFQRETQWSTAGSSCYASAHAKTAVMLPFMGKINQDGLSNKYTDFLYGYQPRPTCTSTNKSCGSPFLWCYLPYGRCVSRLKNGQRCALVSGVDPCFATTCYQGYCRPTGTPGNPGNPGVPGNP